MSKELYKMLKKDRKKGGYTRDIQKKTTTKELEAGRSLSEPMLKELEETDKILELKENLEDMEKMSEEEREIKIRNVLDEVNDRDIDKNDPSRQAIRTANRAEKVGFVAAGLVVLGVLNG